jgi:tRNA 2-thiouridine synthesizing protein D
MNINILVTGHLYSSQSAYSALRFCESAVHAGHIISQVFFYQNGVTQTSRLSLPLEDEFDARQRWANFAADNKVPLVMCISAGERRGMMGDEQAMENQLGSGNLAGNISVAGLGLLHEASLESDRMVSFK